MTHQTERDCVHTSPWHQLQIPNEIQTIASEQNTSKSLTQSAVEVKGRREGQSLAIVSSEAVNTYCTGLCVPLQLLALKTKLC